MWMELGQFLASQHARSLDPCLTLYHDEGYKERDWDLEVCQPFEGEVKESGRIKVRTLPAVQTMACTLHHGPFNTIGEAYEAVVKWIDANGYRIYGPAREVVLQAPAANPGAGRVIADQSDPEGITEVQVPVEKE